MILNIRVTFICLPLLLITACAANSDAQTAATNAPGCVREYRTGSNIPVVDCSALQTEGDRQRALEDVKNEIRTVPRMPRKGEGG